MLYNSYQIVLCGKDMELDDIYFIGTEIEYIKEVDDTLPLVKGKNWLLDVLKRIPNSLKDQGIDINLSKINSWIDRLENYETKVKITPEDAEKLVDDATKWDKYIIKTLGQKQIIEVKTQRGLDARELTLLSNKKPSEFIGSATWKKLSEIEKSDFSDAAKCLILGTATPSVMVALRGAEASIINFYKAKTREDPSPKDTWRRLTAKLKRRSGELELKETFIGYLDYIGDAKRNFAQHPNHIYSIREAVMIFMQVITLVEDIYTQL